jgi:hypothetical protein
MEARQRRQRIVLGALLVTLAGIVVYQFLPGTPTAGQSATVTARPARPTTGAPGARNRPGQPPSPSHVVDVGIGRLATPPPDIGQSGRNPFRFQPRVASRPAPPPVERETPDPSEAVEQGPPPPPPITLKFIGVVSGDQVPGKVAVLSDGKFVYYGREGDIIEGRYRVVRIGEESVQVEYVDGRGRQTIRLTGA